MSLKFYKYELPDEPVERQLNPSRKIVVFNIKEREINAECRQLKIPLSSGIT
jgi:hypothetical protein